MLLRLLCVLLLLSCAPGVWLLRLTGTWNSDSFFLLLTKFGFQRTRSPNRRETEGHIFGNITAARHTVQARSGASAPVILLAVLDRTFFVTFYGNRSVVDRDAACRKMLTEISAVAYDRRCFDDGAEDFLRRIPCPRGRFCSDEDTPDNVVSGYQFTYAIQDIHQPRYWYVSLVACYRDEVTCQWHHSSQPISIEYDIWLVNGNPRKRAQNPLEYQFSFELQDTVEIELSLLGAHTLLVALQLCACARHWHAPAQLLTAAQLTAVGSWLLRAGHGVQMALDGRGCPPVAAVGDALIMAVQLQLLLLLLLLARAWGVPRPRLTDHRQLLVGFAAVSVLTAALHLWNQLATVDPVLDSHQHHTLPGVLSLCLRMAAMLWFLCEVRRTTCTRPVAEDERQLHRLLHFAVGCLLWFLHLPLVALVAVIVSPLWRYKLVLALSGGADLLTLAVLTHLLWPTSTSGRYLQLDADADADALDELEQFSQATHVLLARRQCPHSDGRGAAAVGPAHGAGSPLHANNSKAGQDDATEELLVMPLPDVTDASSAGPQLAEWS